MRSLLLFAITLFCSPSLWAFSYIHAGQLLDTEHQQVRKDMMIKVDGQRIVQVTSAKQAHPTATDTVYDLSAYTVLPGLIDVHVHLTSDAHKHGLRGVADSPVRKAMYGVSAARDTVMAGFTTVRNLGAPAFVDVALRDAIKAGEVMGPNMLVSGPPLCITGGHCDNNRLPYNYHAKSTGVADGPWAVRAQVRENVKYGVDVIKFMASGGVLSAGTKVNASQFTLAEMKALIDEAHERGRKVAAHAHGTVAIKRALAAGVDSIEHGSLIDDEGIALAKKTGAFVDMDIYVDTYILETGPKVGITEESLAKERQVGLIQRQNFRKVHDAGVNMAFATDAGVYPHGDNAKQFKYMVKWGMTPWEAIQAATQKAAELLDWRTPDGQLQVGSIAAGKMADIIAVKRNPLDDIQVLEQVPFVMSRGTVIKH